MPWEKGESGNPKGAPTRNKPFREALLIELNSAGEDHKALRRIARNLIEAASAEADDKHNPVPAIKEVADRLDGKPAQEQIVQGDEDNPLELFVGMIERVIVRPGENK